jgi:hypothetical protein
MPHIVRAENGTVMQYDGQDDTGVPDLRDQIALDCPTEWTSADVSYLREVLT